MSLLIKIIFILSASAVIGIAITNAYFSDQGQISSNTFETGHWFNNFEN